MTVALEALLLSAAAQIRQLCPIPSQQTVTEWAEEFRMLPDTSSSPGPYRVRVAPYQRRWQDLFADPDTTQIVMCWATQTGKSTVIENGLGYRIVTQPSPMILLRPKQEDAEGWAKERFRPMVRATPALAERVRMDWGSDTTLRYYEFSGGFLWLPSARSATELASRSAGVVVSDEVDRMRVIAGEGNPVAIVGKRTTALEVGLEVMTSTPRDAETTLIWPYLEGGTYEYYELPCPHCNEVQPLVWGDRKKDSPGLHWIAGKPETASYVCRGCATSIGEKAKRAWYEEDQGKWLASNPDGKYPSSHLNSLYSPYAKSAWPVLVDEWEKAQGKSADLQVFINARLAELWTETDTRLKADDIMGRLDDDYVQGEVPDGVGILTSGIDVQETRIERYVWGWGEGLESWLIDYDLLPGDPQKEPDKKGSVWAALDAARAKVYKHVSGQEVRVSMELMDTGFATSAVRRYVKGRQRQQTIRASKGIGGALPIIGKPTLQGKERLPVYPAGVDTAKNEFFRSQLLEAKEGPGFVHLPGWLNADQCRQVVSEKRKRKLSRGRVVYAWVQDGPNEFVDCRNYARGALEIKGPKTIAALGRLAAALSKDPDPTPSVRRPKSRKAGWVSGLLR